MKKTYLKLSIIALILINSSCSSLKNTNTQNTKTLTGKWVGNFSWKCFKRTGSEEITFNIIEEKGIISGNVSFTDTNYKIKGYRLSGAELGEWRYQKGQVATNGKNIIIDFINSKNPIMAANTFSGELKNDSISGITQNGVKCSSYKGPSGHFKIKKTIK